MTLIALTLNHGYPIMIGDLLISADLSGHEIVLPTFPNGTGKLFSENGRKPVALHQKLYIINDRLCVGLAGRFSEMQTFLKRIKIIYDDPVKMNVDDVTKFIDDFCNGEGKNLEVIAAIGTYNEETKVFDFILHARGEYRTSEHKHLQEVVALGSGAKRFIEFVKEDSNFGTDLKGAEALFVLNQNIIAYWLGQEVASASSIKELWGAGYEMIVFKDDKFVKVSEYTVVMLGGEFGKGVEYNPAPFKTMMVSYQNDVMIIRVLIYGEEKIFAVPSILENSIGMDVANIDPRHQILLVVYIIEDLDTGMIYTPSLVRPRNVNDVNKSPIFIERVDGSLRIVLDHTFSDGMLKLVLGKKNATNTQQ